MKKIAAIFLMSFTAFGNVEPFLMTTEVPTLINGQVADPKLYPATIWIGNCTASVVGPRTVYTAAHCVGANIAFSVGTQRYSAQCVSAPEYRNNPTADYALCHTDRVVENIPYENVNIDPTHVLKGDFVLQSGFGCTRWGTRLDGQLRVGKAQVLTMPSGTNNDYVTGNGSVLCSGDSGGPAWSLDKNGERDRLISVNSRSDTRTQSYLSAIATATGIRFTNAYATRFSAKICGVHEETANCRKGSPKEPQTFVLENSEAKLTVTWQPTARFSVDDAKDMLSLAINSLVKK